MDPEDDRPDEHALTRDRRQAKRRNGMRVTGRSTRDLPRLIARRDQETLERAQPRAEDERPR